MSKETKIGLLVGLLFIVVFGLVLSQTASNPKDVADPDALAARGDPAAGGLSAAKVVTGPGPVIPAPRPIGHGDGPRTPVTDHPPAEPVLIKVEPRHRTYPVRAGDKIDRIMAAEYGAEYRQMGDQVLKANRLSPTASLKAGKVLTLPVIEVRRDPAATAPVGPVAADNEPTPAPGGKTYTVKPGDSPYKIAKTVMGNAKYADELMAANRDVVSDPRKLRPGMVLKIPETAQR